MDMNINFIRRRLERFLGIEPPRAPEGEYSFQAASFVASYPLKKVEISDRDLEEINAMLPWHAGTLLGGRLLGRLGVFKGKRTRPDPVPDRRIVWLNERLELRDKSVLEVGCFEGIHTLGLRLFSRDVTAIDVRPANVVKTLARLSYHGADAKVFQADVERLSSDFGRFDLLFHCGVLYHLTRPVEHVFSAAGMCSFLFLDTHVAPEEDGREELEFRGVGYQGRYQGEGGWGDPFSGKESRSFWLTEKSLLRALQAAGFERVEFLEKRAERNGPRVALLAFREQAPGA